MTHKTDIQTEAERNTMTGEPTGRFRYRWRCTCESYGPWEEGGKISGSHDIAARNAVRGGQHHVKQRRIR